MPSSGVETVSSTMGVPLSDRLDHQFSNACHRTGVLDLDAEFHALTNTWVLAQKHVLNLERGLLFDEGVLGLVLG